jgi:hypothetical protein
VLLRQGAWNCVTPLNSTSVFFEAVFFEAVLLEVALFEVEPLLTVPVTAVFIVDLALSVLILSPARLQDANMSRARKIKNHLLIAEVCIVFLSFTNRLIDIIVFAAFWNKIKNPGFS